MLNPFGTTFESLEGPTGTVVESVHQSAFQQLLELIESEDGHLISLRAPRAGYGKTMLLARLREKTKGKVTMVPVRLVDGQRIVGEGILEEILTQLTENVPAMAGLTRLDLYTRRLFAHGLLPLVYSGEVPCQDKEGALASLRERPTEALDFHRRDAAIAQWSKQQFTVLAPRLSAALSKSSGASGRDTSYWINLFFNFAVRPPQETSRVGDLMNTVFGRESRFRTGAGFLDGLGAFLNLVTLVEPVILVLDEVDGLSSDTDSALRATSSLVSLWGACRRATVVVSVNDDVWESAFSPRLPAGLRDRLEDVVIRLSSLTQDEASHLISARAGDESAKVIGKLDLSRDDLYPRGVLKAARDVWSRRDESLGDLAEPDAEEIAVEVSDRAAEVEGVSGQASGPIELHDFREQNAPEASSSPATPPEVVESEATGPIASEPELSPFPQTSALAPKSTYPPHPVRRAELPKVFNVQRLRPVESVSDSGQIPPSVSPQSSPFSTDRISVIEPNLSPAPPAPPAPSVQASPFHPSGVSEGANLDSNPFAKVPPFGSAPASPAGVFPAAAQPSPFEIVSPEPPRPQPRQETPPQADADAIDELLRQFREHRDS